MFARGFFRGRFIRRTLSTLGALLALVGGVLVLVASVSTGAGGVSVLHPLQLVLGIGALVEAWWIHRGGKALLFPRARLTFAGFVAAAIGALLFVLGSGTEGLLVLAGGIVALAATAV